MTIGRSYRYSAVLDENMAESKVPHGVAGTPNETALLSLMERTGYGMIQENGQRKYGGPPPGWEGQAPARGCEVFVGKIPRDCYEDELVPVFEKIGNIYELRLMMDFSGSNRGYCFVMYTSRDDAKRAVRELNNFQIRKGRYLGVCLSVDNCRLFVGGIPKNKTKDEILQEMKKVTEGVVDVIVYPSATDKTKNRGFAFVEFESHRAAAMARRKLIPGRIQLWGHTIAVDWAEPEQEVDEDIMAKVKILYVRNLMLSSTEESLEHTFNQAAGKDNAVERVKKIRDYAFVHYRDRDDCLNAMHALDGSALDGSILEVVLAKPVDKNDYVRYTRGAGGKPAVPQPAMPGLQTYYPSLDATTAAYAGMPYYPTQIGAAAAAAAAMTGRPGLERPGMQSRAHLALRGGVRGRGRGAAGSRGAGGVGRGYPSYMRSYRKYAAEENLYDILPGMELTPTNPITLKPQNAKSTAQVLDELCQKNGWGSPVYQLHSTLGRDGSGDMQLFLFKVSIPALTGQYPTSTFQPNKLCRTVEEAKNFAAEYVLMQLGVPMEGGDAPPSIVPAAAAPMAVGTSALVNTSPPPQTLVFSSASLYQGRPIGPNYSLSNGQVPNPAAAAAAALAAVQRCTSADLSSYSTCSMPLGGASTASYMMAPGKLPTPPLPLQSYQAFAAPAMSYGQY